MRTNTCYLAENRNKFENTGLVACVFVLQHGFVIGLFTVYLQLVFVLQSGYLYKKREDIQVSNTRFIYWFKKNSSTGGAGHSQAVYRFWVFLYDVRGSRRIFAGFAHSSLFAVGVLVFQQRFRAVSPLVSGYPALSKPFAGF